MRMLRRISSHAPCADARTIADAGSRAGDPAPARIAVPSMDMLRNLGRSARGTQSPSQAPGPRETNAASAMRRRGRDAGAAAARYRPRARPHLRSSTIAIHPIAGVGDRSAARGLRQSETIEVRLADGRTVRIGWGPSAAAPQREPQPAVPESSARFRRLPRLPPPRPQPVRRLTMTVRTCATLLCLGMLLTRALGPCVASDGFGIDVVNADLALAVDLLARSTGVKWSWTAAVPRQNVTISFSLPAPDDAIHFFARSQGLVVDRFEGAVHPDASRRCGRPRSGVARDETDRLAFRTAGRGGDDARGDDGPRRRADDGRRRQVPHADRARNAAQVEAIAAIVAAHRPAGVRSRQSARRRCAIRRASRRKRSPRSARPARNQRRKTN